MIHIQHPRRLITLIALIGGSLLLAQGSYIHLKAWLAQQLLEQSWRKVQAIQASKHAPCYQDTHDNHARNQHNQDIHCYQDTHKYPYIPPWPWADTSPVARLSVPSLDIEQIILAGDSPRNLAFGPGHNLATPAPGQLGHSLVSAHRDTHFAFLQKLRQGDSLVVETPSGTTLNYRVFHHQVADYKQARLPGDDGEAYLHLVTCYPFDAIDPATTQRYIVSARRLDSPDTASQIPPHQHF